MGLVTRDDGWRIPDWLWKRMAPHIPKPVDQHPLGCHRPRGDDRSAMQAILLVARTGMQWNALNATGICSSSRAHRRFEEWVKAGVFEAFWREGLLDFDALVGINWTWQSADGSTHRAPLGGEKNRPHSANPAPARQQVQPARGGARRARGARARGRQRDGLAATQGHPRQLSHSPA